MKFIKSKFNKFYRWKRKSLESKNDMTPLLHSYVPVAKNYDKAEITGKAIKIICGVLCCLAEKSRHNYDNN